MLSAPPSDSVDAAEMIAKISAILLETPNGEYKEPTPYNSPLKGYSEIDAMREISPAKDARDAGYLDLMREYGSTYSLASSRSFGDDGYLVAIRQQLQSLGSIKNECDAREHTLQQVSNRVNELENLLNNSNDAVKEKDAIIDNKDAIIDSLNGKINELITINDANTRANTSLESHVSELKADIERLNDSFALHSFNSNEERVKFGELYTAQYNEINKLKDENNKLRGLLAAAEDYQQLYEASQRENHELASVLTNDINQKNMEISGLERRNQELEVSNARLHKSLNHAETSRQDLDSLLSESNNRCNNLQVLVNQLGLDLDNYKRNYEVLYEASEGNKNQFTQTLLNLDKTINEMKKGHEKYKAKCEVYDGVICNVSTLMSDISDHDAASSTDQYRADLRALARALQRIVSHKSNEHCPEMLNILLFVGKLIEEVTQFEEETCRVVAELNSNKNNLVLINNLIIKLENKLTKAKVTINNQHENVVNINKSLSELLSLSAGLMSQAGISLDANTSTQFDDSIEIDPLVEERSVTSTPEANISDRHTLYISTLTIYIKLLVHELNKAFSVTEEYKDKLRSNEEKMKQLTDLYELQLIESKDLHQKEIGLLLDKYHKEVELMQRHINNEETKCKLIEQNAKNMINQSMIEYENSYKEKVNNVTVTISEMELDRSTLNDHLRDLILCLEAVVGYALRLETKQRELVVEKRFLSRLASAYDDMSQRLNSIALDIYCETGEKGRHTHVRRRYVSLRILALFVIGVGRFNKLLRNKYVETSPCHLFIPSLETSFSNFHSNSWVLPSLRDLLDSDINDTRGHGIARAVLDSARGSYLLAGTDVSLNAKSILEYLIKPPKSRFDAYSVTEIAPHSGNKRSSSKAKRGFRDYLYRLKTDLYGNLQTNVITVALKERDKLIQEVELLAQDLNESKDIIGQQHDTLQSQEQFIGQVQSNLSEQQVKLKILELQSEEYNAGMMKMMRKYKNKGTSLSTDSTPTSSPSTSQRTSPIHKLAEVSPVQHFDFDTYKPLDQAELNELYFECGRLIQESRSER